MVGLEDQNLWLVRKVFYSGRKFFLVEVLFLFMCCMMLMKGVMLVFWEQWEFSVVCRLVQVWWVCFVLRWLMWEVFSVIVLQFRWVVFMCLFIIWVECFLLLVWNMLRWFWMQGIGLIRLVVRKVFRFYSLVQDMLLNLGLNSSLVIFLCIMQLENLFSQFWQFGSVVENSIVEFSSSVWLLENQIVFGMGMFFIGWLCLLVYQCVLMLFGQCLVVCVIMWCIQKLGQRMLLFSIRWQNLVELFYNCMRCLKFLQVFICGF